MNSSVQLDLNPFPTISLSQMKGVELMRRTDTKYILDENKLNSVLKTIYEKYFILEIQDQRLMTYKSLYFDTDSNDFYHNHHNGKLNRTKIRMRYYVESELTYFEIKQKDSKGKTNKSRLRIERIDIDLSKNAKEFVTKKTGKTYQLYPFLWNHFNRFTLVSKTEKERVTIDLNLSYNFEESAKSFNKLVIIEVKQERFNRNSIIVQELKSQGIQPFGFSKYCLGMLSLHNELKYNAFKSKLLKINKLTPNSWNF
ncbi:MAG: polyphosphate polymerase domain-containing protein [Bacteroidetes bacterium]|nr:polyphosphate polymerase domain-containing protein [Bacteroidota bacterium]